MKPSRRKNVRRPRQTYRKELEDDLVDEAYLHLPEGKSEPDCFKIADHGMDCPEWMAELKRRAAEPILEAASALLLDDGWTSELFSVDIFTLILQFSGYILRGTLYEGIVYHENGTKITRKVVFREQEDTEEPRYL